MDKEYILKELAPLMEEIGEGFPKGVKCLLKKEIPLLNKGDRYIKLDHMNNEYSFVVFDISPVNGYLFVRNEQTGQESIIHQSSLYMIEPLESIIS